MKQQVEIKEMIMAKLAEQGVQVTKSDLDKMIKIYTEVIKEDLFETGKTKLPGIGILELRYRGARDGKNPATKEPMRIPESLSVGLSASTIIKKEISEAVDIAKYRK